MADAAFGKLFDSQLSTALEEDARVGRAAVRGAVVGTLGVGLLVTIGGLLCGLTAASAFGLGVFVGMWGGLGFGFMFGASCAGMHLMDSHDARD
jgi:hypothetical protein